MLVRGAPWLETLDSQVFNNYRLFSFLLDFWGSWRARLHCSRVSCVKGLSPASPPSPSFPAPNTAREIYQPWNYASFLPAHLKHVGPAAPLHVVSSISLHPFSSASTAPSARISATSVHMMPRDLSWCRPLWTRLRLAPALFLLLQHFSSPHSMTPGLS